MERGVEIGVFEVCTSSHGHSLKPSQYRPPNRKLFCFGQVRMPITLRPFGFSSPALPRTHKSRTALHKNGTHAKSLGDANVAYLILDHNALERRRAHAAENLQR